VKRVALDRKTVYYYIYRNIIRTEIIDELITDAPGEMSLSVIS